MLVISMLLGCMCVMLFSDLIMCVVLVLILVFMVWFLVSILLFFWFSVNCLIWVVWLCDFIVFGCVCMMNSLLLMLFLVYLIFIGWLQCFLMISVCLDSFCIFLLLIEKVLWILIGVFLMCMCLLGMFEYIMWIVLLLSEWCRIVGLLVLSVGLQMQNLLGLIVFCMIILFRLKLEVINIMLWKLDLVFRVNSMLDELMFECIISCMLEDRNMFLCLKLWWMWQVMVWLLYSEVNIFLILCMMLLVLVMLRKVFCWLVKEVLGRFLVVVEECMVMVMLLLLFLLYSCLQVLWMFWFSCGCSGVLIIQLWIFLLVVVSVVIFFMFSVVSLLKMCLDRLLCVMKFLKVLVVVV